MDKTLEYYRRLPYTLYAQPVSDAGGNYWTAEYVELRGCKTDGSSEAEAVDNLHELFDEYVLARLGQKSDIPEPVRLPNPVNEILIFIRERVSSRVFSRAIQDTQQTKGETQPEMRAIPFEEIVA